MKTYADADGRASGPQPIEHLGKPEANRFNHYVALSTSVCYLALRSPRPPRLFSSFCLWAVGQSAMYECRCPLLFTYADR